MSGLRFEKNSRGWQRRLMNLQPEFILFAEIVRIQERAMEERFNQAGKGPDGRRVLDAAMEAGHILLQNGAEISRVEETM